MGTLDGGASLGRNEFCDETMVRVSPCCGMNKKAELVVAVVVRERVKVGGLEWDFSQSNCSLDYFLLAGAKNGEVGWETDVAGEDGWV